MKVDSSKLLDVLCFVLGPTLLVFGLSGFGDKVEYAIGSLGFYLYPEETRYELALGAALLAFGILRRNWRHEASHGPHQR